MPNAPYGDYWKLQRRLWHQHLGAEKVLDYTKLIEGEVQVFVNRLWISDETTSSQIRLYVCYFKNSHPSRRII